MRCTNLATFHQATGNGFKLSNGEPKATRMADRDLALRFFAFRQGDWKTLYTESESLDAFLFSIIKRIDGMSQNELSLEMQAFEAAMENAYRLFDGNAFRRWPLGGRKGPLNRSLFESWAVALSEVNWADLEMRKDAIVTEMRRLMLEDKQYIDSFTIATTDLSRVESRVKTARDILMGRSS